MAHPTDLPRPRRPRRVPSGRGRVALVVGAVTLVLLATSLRGVAQVYTDYLWFDSLGLSRVWSGILGARISLVAIFTVTFFALMFVNLTVAERVSGRTIRFGGTSEDELVLRYRELVGRHGRLVRVATSGALALIAGAGTSAQWDAWILFRNRQSFGIDDETFGHDIGFYVFQLPFLRFVSGWLFASLIVVLVATLVFHYLNGGISLQATQDRVSAPVKAHISVLLALLALVRASQYALDRFDLVYSTRGPVQGATYTDVNVQTTAISLLIMISLFATVLFIANIWRRGWALPLLAVGLWGLVAVLAGEAVPTAVQQFRVRGNSEALERPYVQHNLTATKAASGLDGIEERDFAADGLLTGDQLLDNEETVRNIRLWDTEQLGITFQRLEGSTRFYEVSDVDVDRYTIDGRTQQMMVATRELGSDLPNPGWESSRLVYTSGYGAVMAPANAKTGDGRPEIVVGGIPVASDEDYPEVTQPSLYFSEGQTGYKIVNTSREELVLQDEDETNRYGQYEGRDGVPLDSFVRQAAFALRFGEYEPIVSPSIQPDSKVLLRRDIRERVEDLAPFLAFDSDPYAVVVDGRLVYVIDAYTTTDRYPNAQRIDVGRDLDEDSGLARRRFNYVRNPVKAVVDAYDGTVSMYITDQSDPLITAYAQAFPQLFTDVEEAPADLRAHFRYPEDLFRVQTNMWARYHVDTPDQLIFGNSEWAVAPPADASSSDTAPTTTAATTTTTTAPVNEGVTPSSGERAIDPTYQLLRLPGEEQEDFVLTRPFTPKAREQLTSFMAATPGGRLISYEMPTGIEGPGAAANIMRQDPKVSSTLTLLGRQQGGNQLSFGNVLLVPIEQSIVYVRPLYVTTPNGSSTIKAVVTSVQRPDGTSVAVASTLAEALERLFGAAPATLEAPLAPDETDITDSIEDPASTEDPTDPTVPSETDPADEPTSDTFDGTDDELVAAIEAAFDEAEAAFERGDTAAWVAALDEAEALFRELAARREAADATEGSGGDAPAEEPADEPADTPAPTTTPPSTTAPPDGPTTTTRPTA